MAPPTDPYRTLGLARDASLEDVKRAYRRLAKENHPDAAGPAALPRFLAIQAAYEQLVDGRGRSARAGAEGAGSGAGAGPAPRASAADPDRANATHRAYAGRSRRTRPGATGSARTRTGRPATGPSDAGATGAGEATGGAGASDRGAAADGAGGATGGSAGRRGRIGHRGGLGNGGRPPDARQGDARVHLVRRRRGRAVRAGLGRRELVRHDLGDLLDDQPQGIRGPAQARPGIPGPSPPRGPGRRRRGRRRRG